MPIDVVVDLMADSGSRDVLEALAELADCLLLPLQLDGDDDSLARDLAAFGREVSSTFARYHDAMADGRLDQRERDDLVEIISRVQRCTGRMLRTLREDASS